MPANTAAAVQNRGGLPSLVFDGQDGSHHVFVLPAESASAEVGRGRSADLRFAWDDQVSRLHARLERVGDEWEVVDGGLSRNGTFVNDERLTGKRRLRHGDTVRFGSTTVTFSSPGQQQPVAARTPVTVNLSTTQRHVLEALCRRYMGRRGSTNPATDGEIAEELVLSVGEVQTHLRVLCAKLGIERLSGQAARVQLAERAASAGLIARRDI